eukprot:1158743-Pelagomonas_calceolata.AAC.3
MPAGFCPRSRRFTSEGAPECGEEGCGCQGAFTSKPIMQARACNCKLASSVAKVVHIMLAPTHLHQARQPGMPGTGGAPAPPRGGERRRKRTRDDATYLAFLF